MPTFQSTGRAGLTKAFTATAYPGTTISFDVPVKSFIIMPKGGDITFRFNTADLEADAFPISDGQSFQFDMSLPYPIASNSSTIGFISGGATPYVAIAF